MNKRLFLTESKARKNNPFGMQFGEDFDPFAQMAMMAMENIDIYDVKNLDDFEILKEMIFKAERTFQSYLDLAKQLWASRKSKQEIF